MNIPILRFAACLGPLACIPSVRAQTMTVSSFDGAVTASEIASFKTFMQATQPVVWPNTNDMANQYAQGTSGEQIKAMGLMYEMTGDTTILDRMIYFADVLLEERNDILAAPNGQREVWTGTIAPVWPGNVTNPASADAANGDCAGHLAYCARLILQTSSIWNTPVAIGDVYDHGATYGERAATFVAEADYVVSRFFLADLLNLSNSNEYYYSTASPYKSGDPLPWNQQMMITHGLENLAAAHEILGDNPTLQTQYDSIVQANLNWFFGSTTNLDTFTDSDGNTAYDWAYSPGASSGEDSNHGSLDCAGFFRAWLIGRYGITNAMMTPFANTFCDIMTLGPDSYAGTVDGINGTGHAAFDNYVRSGFLLLSYWRPEQYYGMVGADLSPGGNTTSTDTFSRFLWVKNQRYLGGYAVEFSPVPGLYSSAQSVSLSTWTSGASVYYTTNGTTPTPTSGTLYTGPFNVASTTSVQAISYSGGVSSPVSTATYTFAAGKPAISPAGGYFGTAQTMTLTSSTSGASIYYTTDGSIPSATNGTLYSGPVSITGNTVVTAVAIASGLSNSALNAASFFVGAEAVTPTISPNGGTYSSPQTVTLSCGTSGATIYYSTQGSATTGSTVYSGPITVGGNLTVSAIAVASGVNQSQTANAAFTINTAAAAPTMSPAAGTYTGDQMVTLSTTTPGATMIFTLDGSNPINGGGMAYIYLKPFKVTANQTVQAYTFAPGVNASSVSSAAYVINNVLPSPWADADIGAPTPSGSASYSSGHFTISGGGSDIFGTADQFHFAYQPSSGSETLQAQVVSQTDTNAWAKSGVMIRQSTAANSPYVGIYLTPGKGVDMQYRSSTGAGATDLAEVSGITAPTWVQLVRAGNTFTGYYSSNGTSWTEVGSISVSMPINVLSGIAVCAHNTSSLSTGVFWNVSLSDAATQFSIPGASVTASTYHSGYPPANTVDGTMTVANRWAALGTTWIQYDLGAVHDVTSINIAWSYTNVYPFSVAVSDDAVNWTTVLSGQQSNGTALEYQTFIMPANTTGRYVRFNCTGCTEDHYTNITQTQIFGY